MSKSSDLLYRAGILDKTGGQQRGKYMLIRVHMIRHGITEGNQQKKLYGTTDLPLTEAGVKALKNRAAAKIYPKKDGAAFFTSGMLRTEQTLNIIYGDIIHTPVDDLKEMSFGEFENYTFEDLKNHPDYIEWYGDKSGDRPAPRGESFNEFTERVMSGFKIVTSAAENSSSHTSIVICHAGPIVMIMNSIFPGAVQNPFNWLPAPGHGYTVIFSGDKVSGYTRF